MKAKKLVALCMSAAMVVGGASLMAACKDKTPSGGGFVEDTRIWYAVGNDSKGTAKVNGWKPQTINDELKFVRDTTVTDENVFTLSMDIYAGDEGAGYGFKFLYKTSATETIIEDDLWARQIGIHNFEGVEGEGEAAVLKSDGKTVFTTGGGSNLHNLYLEKGWEGTYKFTLTTYPDGKGGDAKDPVLKFERTKVIEVTHDMWIHGDVNNFGWGATADKYPMKEVISGDDITWTTQVKVTDADLVRDANGALLPEAPEEGEAPGAGEDAKEGENAGTVVVGYAAVQVYNRIESNGTHATYVADSEDYKVVEIEGSDYMLLPKGNYTITYDQKTNEVVVASGTHDMYLIGSWYADPENKNDYGWGYGEGYKDFPLKQADNIWSRVQYFAAATELKLYNALTDTYYTTPENVEDGKNIKITEPGNYAFRFDQETGVVQVEKCEYYLVGTFVDAKGAPVNFGDKGIIADVHPKFEKDGNNYVATVTAIDVTGMDAFKWIKDQGKDGVFGIQIVMGSTILGIKDWGVAGSDDNIFLYEGTYTVTIDTSDWHYTATPVAAE